MQLAAFAYPRQRALLLVLAALPALELLWRGARAGLGANPIEELTHVSGDWALRLLLASLAVTPLREWFGWRWLAPHRRTLGLLSFAYAGLHLLVYLALDQGLAWEFIWDDLLERPYIGAGFASFACLLPLAITSSRGWVRRLGRRWTALHRLVYPAAIAAVVHRLWIAKLISAEASAYALALGVLLGARVLRSARRRARAHA